MQPQPPSHGERSSVRLPRILVVDDEAGFTRLMKMNLEATGRYVVHAENDPQKAFHAATEFHPDLVLLDIMMPGLDGGDVASRFKNDAHLKRVPVIFLTATVRRAEVDARHGDFGGEHFLSKPIALPELLKCLDEHFASTDQKTLSMRA
jgi:CheY-like chemotaxis protein